MISGGDKGWDAIETCGTEWFEREFSRNAMFLDTVNQQLCGHKKQKDIVA